MPKLDIKKITWDFFKQKKSYVIYYLFLILSYPLKDVACSKYYGELLELVINRKDLTGTVIKTLSLLVTSMIGMSTLTKLDSKTIPQFRSHLYREISKYIFEIHKEDYTNIKIGELVSKLSKIPYLILELFYQIRSSYLPTVYLLFFCTLYFFSFNSALGILVLGVVFSYFIITLSLKRSCMPSCVSAETSGDSTNENLQDILENILSVYSSNSIEDEIKAMDAKNNNLQENMSNCLNCASKYKSYFSTMYIASFSLLCGFIYSLYKAEKITLAQTTTALVISVHLLSNIDWCVQYMADTISYIGSIIDIQNYIDGLNERYENNTYHINKLNRNLYTGELDTIKGKVTFKDIHLCFGQNCILRNFNYTIEPKEKIAIVGNIGSGKSSLLKMILKLTYPTKGQILIDDKNLPYDKTRNYVSYIGQSPILFNRTLYDNIVYGTNKTRDDVVSLMKTYGLERVFGNRTLDDNVGKGGNLLSGGQKQIVIILRSVLRDTPVVLLDEPTTALDNKNKELILDTIFKIFEDKTMIMVTHDQEAMKRFNHFIKLN
jgi:ABC-type multidrug transport system fused ATPase/permease subunit